jgi:hypothetical protein
VLYRVVLLRVKFRPPLLLYFSSSSITFVPSTLAHYTERLHIRVVSRRVVSCRVVSFCSVTSKAQTSSSFVFLFFFNHLCSFYFGALYGTFTHSCRVVSCRVVSCCVVSFCSHSCMELHHCPVKRLHSPTLRAGDKKGQLH